MWESSDPLPILDLGGKVAEWAGLVWSRVVVGQGAVVAGGVGVPRAGYVQILVGLSTYRDCDLYGWV